MCRSSGDFIDRNAELLIRPVIGEGSQKALSISAKPKHAVVVTTPTFVQPVNLRLFFVAARGIECHSLG